MPQTKRNLFVTTTIKSFDYLKGFSAKDTISNVGGLLGLIGSIMLINIQSGLLDAKHEKQAQGLIGTSFALVAFVTGKSANLKSGQVDRTDSEPPLQ